MSFSLIGNISALTVAAGLQIVSWPDASLAITATRSFEGVAPEGIWFTATPTGFDVTGPTGGEIYDATVHDVEYKWDFGQSGYFEYPFNVLAIHAERNVAYGKSVPAVFEPGNHTVTCTAKDRSGNVAVSTYVFDVADPAVAYPAADTHLVAPDSNFEGESGTQHTTLTAAINAITANGRVGRIRLKRNNTYPISATEIKGTSRPGFRLEDFGSGAKPVVDMETASGTLLTVNEFNDKDVVFRNIRFQGAWDSVTETGTRQTGLYFPAANHYTVTGCEFDGFKISIYPRFFQPDGRFFFVDNSIDNRAEYGILGGSHTATQEDAIIAVRGNRIVQLSTARQGGANSIGLGNSQGPMRLFTSDKIYVGQNDGFGNEGWSYNNGVPAVQSFARISSVPEGAYVMMERNGIENCSISIVPTSGVTRINAVIDKNIMIGSTNMVRFIEAKDSGITARNNLFVQPDVRAAGQPVYGVFDMDANTGDAQAMPDWIYANTVIDLRTNANNNGIVAALVHYDGGDAADRTTTAENNIFYAPNRDAPLTSDGPFVDGGEQISGPAGLLSPRFTEGVNYFLPDDPLIGARQIPNDGTSYLGPLLIQLPEYANPADAWKQYVPATGAGAIGAVTSGKFAWDDIFQNPRSATLPHNSGAVRAA